MNKILAEEIKDRKNSKLKIVALTAYSASDARRIDSLGLVDILVVADALGTSELGYENPLAVTLEEMIHHTKAVTRIKPKALVMADMPYLTYEVSPMEAVRNAGRLIKEGSAGAVRVRAGGAALRSIKEIVVADIAVMGYIQKTNSGPKAMELARALEQAGCFALCLDRLPRLLARDITRALAIPTVGYKSGPYCDGEMIPTEELLGSFTPRIAQTIRRFVRQTRG